MWIHLPSSAKDLISISSYNKHRDLFEWKQDGLVSSNFLLFDLPIVSGILFSLEDEKVKEWVQKFDY